MGINLSGITKQAVDTVFNLADQIVSTGSYIRTGATADPEYNPSDGSIDENATTFANVQGMILPFKAREIDGETVKTGDEKVLIRTEDLPALGEPERDDRFIVGAVRRDVIGFTKDPTNQFWILHCRRFSN